MKTLMKFIFALRVAYQVIFLKLKTPLTMSEKVLEELYEIFCDLYEDDGSYEKFLKSKIANKFSSLESEIERLKGFEALYLKGYIEILSLKAEIEQLKSSASTKGVRELLRKQREICYESYCGHISGTDNMDGEDRIKEAPEPDFLPKGEDNKENSLNKEDTLECIHCETWIPRFELCEHCNPKL